MRELVAKYLSHAMSRRRFVNGLTQAGLTATAAHSVLASVTSVSLAQGAGNASARCPMSRRRPQPARAGRAAGSRRGETVPGQRRRRLRRAAHRLRGEICVRQLGERRRASSTRRWSTARSSNTC